MAGHVEQEVKAKLVELGNAEFNSAHHQEFRGVSPQGRVELVRELDQAARYALVHVGGLTITCVGGHILQPKTSAESETLTYSETEAAVQLLLTVARHLPKNADESLTSNQLHSKTDISRAMRALQRERGALSSRLSQAFTEENIIEMAKATRDHFLQ